MTQKKEKIRSLKQKINQYSDQVSNLLTIIEKKEILYKPFIEKENQNSINFEENYKCKTEYLPSNKQKTTNLQEKFLAETNSKQERLKKYNDLEKYALKIMNDFD